jgi:hypothetical protein
MLIRKKATAECGVGTGNTTISKCVPFKKCNNNSLFRNGTKLLVHRAPIMAGLSAGTKSMTTFQRPMLGRRSYSKHADVALKQSSLGMKRRMDGMSKLLARAGRGLSFQLPTTQVKKSSSDTEDDSDNDEGPPADVPYEPLLVWKSPHNGGELKGLPSTTYVFLAFLVDPNNIYLNKLCFLQ